MFAEVFLGSSSKAFPTRNISVEYHRTLIDDIYKKIIKI